MAVSETARTWLNRPVEEADSLETIIVGNISVPALKYLAAHGTRIEEFKGLYFLTLPYESEVSRWRREGDWDVTTWTVSFDADGGEIETKPGALHVVIESALVAFESRCYVVAIPIVPRIAEAMGL